MEMVWSDTVLGETSQEKSIQELGSWLQGSGGADVRVAYF